MNSTPQIRHDMPLSESGRPQRAVASAAISITTAMSPATPRKRARVAETHSEDASGVIESGSSAVGAPIGHVTSQTQPRKKRTAPQPAKSLTTPPAARILIPLHTAPVLLPPVLPFSLSDAINHLSTHDPRFGILHSYIPPKPFSPPIEPVDPFRSLVTSIIGQQVSWLAAKAITKRFRSIWGFDSEDGFPTPLEVSKGEVADYRAAGFSQRKAEYVIAIAEHFVSGQISTELLREGTDEEIAKALIAVRGIGQWTVDMFLMFSLRRADILPVGDLGVQKGLLKWILAAHGALPPSTKRGGKKAVASREKYNTSATSASAKNEEGTGITIGETKSGGSNRTPPPEHRANLPPTPHTPNAMSYSPGPSREPSMPVPIPQIPRAGVLYGAPPTPHSPGDGSHRTPGGFDGLVQVEDRLAVPSVEAVAEDEVPSQDVMMSPPVHHRDWNAHRAAPLKGGLSIETLKARLAGKKVKGGAYLTPKEMEVLTEGWRPYRSVGVYYMWPVGEDS